MTAPTLVPEPMTVLLTSVPDIFRPRELRRSVARKWIPGATLAEYLPPECAEAPPECFLTSLNGKRVTIDDRNRVIPEPGDAIVILVTPGIGVLIYAALVVTVIAITLWHGMDQARRAKVQGHHAARRAARRAEELEDSMVYGWTPTRNTVRPGTVIPILYGRLRVGGQLIYSRARIDTFGRSVIDVILCVSEGQVNGFESGTVEINGKPISSYTGVEMWWRLGTATQDVLPIEMDRYAVVTTNRPYRPLNFNSAVTYVTANAVDGFRIEIGWKEFLRWVSNNAFSYAVSFSIRWRVFGTGVYGPARTFWANNTGSITAPPLWPPADGSRAFTAEYRSPILTRARWEVEITRTLDVRVSVNSPGFNTSDQAWLDFFEERDYQRQRYPGLAVLGLKAIATEQLSGEIPTVTAIWQGKLIPVWNNDDPPTFTDTYSQNPAWVILDILTNTRYGGGTQLNRAVDLDLSSFSTAATFCNAQVNDQRGGVTTEVRARCDTYFDGSTDVWSAANAVAASAKLAIVFSGGLVKLIADQERVPIQVFSMGNIVAGSYKHSYLGSKATATRVEVQCLNQEQNYEMDVAEMEDPDAQTTSGDSPVKQTIEARTITRPSEARRLAEYNWRSNRYENEVIEFETGADAIALEWNDVFIFVHETTTSILASGRCKAGSTTTAIKVDKDITIPSGAQADLYVRYNAGTLGDTVDNNPITTPVGLPTTDTITVSPALSQVPLEGDIWAITQRDYATGASRRAWKTLEIVKTEDHTRKIRAVNYRAEVYTEPTATVEAV